MPGKHAIAALAMLFPGVALAQQQPDIGIAPVELADEPYVFDTAEVHGIEVTVLARDLPGSFSIAFLPGGDLLVGARAGGVHVIRDATGADPVLLPDPLAGMPEPPEAGGTFGLHDLEVAPDFAETGLVYWTWNIPVPNADDPEEPPETGRFSIMRGRLTDGGMTDVETIYEAADLSYPAGTRLALTPEGTLWATTGAPFGDAAQDASSPYGKVLRLSADGSPHAGNPSPGPGALGEIYSLGHRDQHGLAVAPDGSVLTVEHGPNGGDELNLIRPGANYGWPDYSLGRNYDGTAMDVPLGGDGITPPLVAWLPSIAPSALMIYTGDAFPEWQGNAFVASARRGEVNRTGGLERVVFNEDWGELRRETLLTQLHQRVRDVVEGPDGLIYVLTDGDENAVLRVAPADLEAN